MNLTPETALFLLVGGLTNGAIYALVGLGLVLIYGVTRVVNIAQGEFVTLGALTTVSLLAGSVPVTLDILILGGLVWAVWDAFLRLPPARAAVAAVLACLVAGGLWLVVHRALPGLAFPYPAAAAVSVLAVGATGALMYRFFVQTVPESSEGLIYLIVTTGLFIALEGLVLAAWGSQGAKLPPAVAGAATVAGVRVPYQNLFVLLAAGALVAGFFLYFERTIGGKALRAAAVNRLGARLVGISPARAGLAAFALSAAASAFAGVLIGAIIIVNYNTGLPLGLKGFIGAVIGGMTSFPGAVVGGLVVGLLESFGGYVNSALREVIVYGLLFAILVGRVVRLRRPRRSARPARKLA